MPSFDIVSELNLPEVDNAINQASKELAQRFDFRGTDSRIERKELEVRIESADEYKVKAAYDVLQTKLVRRQVSLKALDAKEPAQTAKGRMKIEIQLRKGIDTDRARELVKTIKGLKLKVQAAIQDEQLRVTGKKKDDLQEAMAAVRALDFPLPLQFTNFRD